MVEGLLSGEVILAGKPGISLTFACQGSQLSRVYLSLAPHFSFKLKGGTEGLQHQLQEWLLQYLEGKAPLFPINLLPQTFSAQVLKHLVKIPFGETVSYAQVAEALGNPRAARAVGNACRVNPFPLLIPCHRVISASGRLGGFSPQLMESHSKDLKKRTKEEQEEQQELKWRLLNFEGSI